MEGGIHLLGSETAVRGVLRARTRLTDMVEVFQKVRVLNIYKAIRESEKVHV